MWANTVVAPLPHSNVRCTRCTSGMLNMPKENQAHLWPCFYFSVPLQSSSISATCWASLTTETHRSEGPRPSSVEPSYRLHSPKHDTTYTAGWPVWAVQQVCVCEGICTGVLWYRHVESLDSVFTCMPCFSPGNPLSLVDLVPLLQKTLKDESSVTCKMTCSAVRVRHHVRTCVRAVFLWVWGFWLCLSALHNDSVQQHHEWARPAVADRPAGSEGLLLLACTHRTLGDAGWDGLSVGWVYISVWVTRLGDVGVKMPTPFLVFLG